jgi:nicotinate-nucleotide adenylyltransferase
LKKPLVKQRKILAMKVGIYPGAFDPIHNGHLAFAEASMRQFTLDKVFFLPEPQPRHKQAVKSFEHRQHMVQLAISHESRFGLILVEHQQFTIHETWPSVTARFSDAELYMLLGSDVAHRLSTWPHIDELIRMAPRFLIAQRAGKRSEVDDMVKTLKKTTKVPFNYEIVRPGYETHSSRSIRLALKKGEIPGGLAGPVAEYIQAERLYISGAD